MILVICCDRWRTNDLLPTTDEDHRRTRKSAKTFLLLWLISSPPASVQNSLDAVELTAQCGAHALWNGYGHQLKVNLYNSVLFKLSTYPGPTGSFIGNRIVFERSTACGHRMAHRKWKDTKLQPGTAGPGNMIGCCLFSFHILWAILCPQAVLSSCVFSLPVAHGDSDVPHSGTSPSTKQITTAATDEGRAFVLARNSRYHGAFVIGGILFSEWHSGIIGA